MDSQENVLVPVPIDSELLVLTSSFFSKLDVSKDVSTEYVIVVVVLDDVVVVDDDDKGQHSMLL